MQCLAEFIPLFQVANQHFHKLSQRICGRSCLQQRDRVLLHATMNVSERVVPAQLSCRPETFARRIHFIV
jgi:hypothetical protein